MTRIIDNHRCKYRPNPFYDSGHKVRVETMSGELVGVADPFPSGVPFQAFRRESAIKETAKALIRAAKEELVK